MPDPGEVRGLFGRIARRYDLLNRVLSLGIDRRWRRRAVRVAGDVKGRVVVDVCCGTGDLTIEFARAGARVLGFDFTPQMLSLSVPKSRSLGLSGLYAQADALQLPLKGAAADVASVAFGLRNLADPQVGLAELARVVKPGGCVLVLEFSPPPRGVVGAVYRLYFTRVLPWIGAWISGDAEAYRYLPRTVSAWLAPDELQQRMELAGLVDCGHESLTLGIASLHWGRVAARSERGVGLDRAAPLEGAVR
jgi:demethylmenaquinone methyltransferase/2-methoxy-6-polyprenyl-1,4-benzoquinol methylase